MALNHSEMGEADRRRCYKMYESLYKSLNYANLVNANKLWIPILFLWASHLEKKSCFVPPRQPALNLQKLFGNISYKTRRTNSLAKYARRDLSVPAKTSQQTQHAAQQYITASILSVSDLLSRPKMVDTLLLSLPTRSQWSVRHVPFRPVP